MAKHFKTSLHVVNQGPFKYKYFSEIQFETERDVKVSLGKLNISFYTMI